MANYGLDPRFNPQVGYQPPPQQPIVPPQMQGPPPVAGAGGPGMPPGMPPPGAGPGAPPGGPGAPPQAGAQGSLDPRMVQAILALQGQESQRSSVEKQYALADQLRADAKNQVKGVQAGRTFVGPGWGNVLASLGQTYAGERLGNQADTRGQKLDEDASDASADWVGAVTGKPVAKRKRTPGM